MIFRLVVIGLVGVIVASANDTQKTHMLDGIKAFGGAIVGVCENPNGVCARAIYVVKGGVPETAARRPASFDYDARERAWVGEPRERRGY